MLNTVDRENVIKCNQSANLLMQNLRDLVQAGDPLLAEIALEIQRQAVQIEQRLGRVELLVHLEEKVA